MWVSYFKVDFLQYAHTIWPDMTQFGKVVHMRGVFRGLAVPNFGGSFNLCVTLWHRTTKSHMATHKGRRIVLGNKSCPCPKGTEPQPPPILAFSFIYAYILFTARLFLRPTLLSDLHVGQILTVGIWMQNIFPLVFNLASSVVLQLWGPKQGTASGSSADDSEGHLNVILIGSVLIWSTFGICLSEMVYYPEITPVRLGPSHNFQKRTFGNCYF